MLNAINLREIFGGTFLATSYGTSLIQFIF